MGNVAAVIFLVLLGYGIAKMIKAGLDGYGTKPTDETIEDLKELFRQEDR